MFSFEHLEPFRLQSLETFSNEFPRQLYVHPFFSLLLEWAKESNKEEIVEELL